MVKPDLKSQELAAIIAEIRSRVQSRSPQGEAYGLGVPLPDLLPILHARDAAEAKVASIGGVNPRPEGLVNNLIQWIKRQIARSLQWFVRDQIEFNRAVLATVEATLDSLNEVNRTFMAAGARLDEIRPAWDVVRAEASELKDIRVHWLHWREDWQKKLHENEIHFLRSVADLQASFGNRLVATDSAYREAMKLQHAEFTRSTEEAADELQRKFWDELGRIRQEFEKVRLEFERLIHNELRVIRQKSMGSAAAAGVAQPAPSSAPLPLDYTRFSDRFRGTEEYVRKAQQFYLPVFRSCRNVLDIGCGRGEFLELMRDAGVPARGLDLDTESVAICRAKGLEADEGDLFQYLKSSSGFDGIFASQVIEHLPPERLPVMIQLCSKALRQGGVLALETPNPECLAIFATHFYLDPTHTRPVPPNLSVFYMEEAGFGGIGVHRLSPAADSFPEIGELPDGFRNKFFGGLDYAIIGRKL